MSAEEGDHSASEVSDAFVKQYFHILQHLPEEARRFYVTGSVVSRPGLDGSMLSFTSLESINEQILSCDYKDATFDVISVDSQNSFESGIFIMVTGFLTGKDKLRRKFSQSFYLARQNNVYVVLNDILRYVGDEASGPAAAALSIPEPKQVTEMAKPAVEANQKEPVQEIGVSVENSEDVAREVTPLENGTIEKSDGKAEKPTEPIAPKALPDATKRSFASIVQSMAQNTAPYKAPVQKPKPMGQLPHAAAAAAAAPQEHCSVLNSDKKDEEKIMEEPGTSIFVANLPMSAMPDELHGMFKSFGPIKENGIQVRSSRGSGICFGFVAFESATSVQSVLQASKTSPFVLGDRKLRIKEKQVDYDGSKPSGRNGGLSKSQNGWNNRRNSGRNGHQRAISLQRTHN